MDSNHRNVSLNPEGMSEKALRAVGGGRGGGMDGKSWMTRMRQNPDDLEAF